MGDVLLEDGTGGLLANRVPVARTLPCQLARPCSTPALRRYRALKNTCSCLACKTYSAVNARSFEPMHAIQSVAAATVTLEMMQGLKRKPQQDHQTMPNRVSLPPRYECECI